MIKIILLILTFNLIGCAGIPISSMYKMMTVNPLEFHPKAISIAIKRPHAIQINNGDVKMQLMIKSVEPELNLSEQYFLVVDNAPQIPLVGKGVKQNEAFTVLTLSAADVSRMIALQVKMKQHLKNGGKKGDFGFAVSVLEGCKNAQEIPAHVLISLYLKLDAQSEYFPLYEDFNLGKADLSPLKNLEDWDVCSN